MFDSYIKREGKQYRYQLLRINLVMLAFQFQEYWFGMQDRARLIRNRAEVIRQCLIPISKEKGKIAISYSGLTWQCSLSNWRILIWNARLRSAYKEWDGNHQAMFDSYIKREGKKSLSVTQDKIDNACFSISRVLIWNARLRSAYKDTIGLLWSRFWKSDIEALPKIKVCLQKIIKSSMLIKNNRLIIHNYTTT